VAPEWRHRTLILEGRTGQLPKYGAKGAGENARLVDRTFEAYGTTPCNLPSTQTTTQPMPLSQVQIGAVVTVFYQPKETKVDGRRQKKNQVIGILFQEVNSLTRLRVHGDSFDS